MGRRSRLAIRTGALTAALAGLSACASGGSGYRVPRTAFGAPDLQGVWTNDSLTTLERDDRFKELVVPESEVAHYEKVQNDPTLSAAEDEAMRLKEGKPKRPDVGQEFSEFQGEDSHLARFDGKARSSWLLDPADGQLPYKPEAKAEMKAARKRINRNFDDPEARPLGERCLIGIGSPAGPPLMNAPLNADYQIVQSPGVVAIVAEMNHDARLIRIDPDRAHAPPQIRPWMGDSVGWWEGDALVVESTGFNPGERLRPVVGGPVMLSGKARVSERFMRTAPDQILYSFEVEDSEIYTKPWRGEMLLRPHGKTWIADDCHEGNYSLAGILGGARRVERDGGVPEPMDGGDPPTSAPTVAKAGAAVATASKP